MAAGPKDDQGLKQADDSVGMEDYKTHRPKKKKSKGRDEEYVKDARECAPNDHACEVDRKVRNIENEIKSQTKGYDDGSVWQIGKDDDAQPRKGKTKYGYKALKLAVNAPVYAFRAVTWPVAVFARYLIDKGVVESLVDFFSNKERTLWVYPTLELGFGYGLGVGFGIRHTDLFNENYKLAVDYQIHLSLDQAGGVSFRKPDAAMINGHPLAYKIATDWIHYYDVDFYGIGSDASKDDDSIFKIDTIRWGGEVEYELIDRLNLLGQLYFVNDWTGAGEDGSPSVDVTFPPAELQAFGKFLFYMVPAIVLRYDSRDATAAPQGGGLHFASIRHFQGLNRQDFDYNEYEMQFLQYIRLWAEGHVLALRTDWVFEHSTRGNIPFYRLAVLDAYTPARGFSSGRFHDNIRAIFNIEYRFPVWSFIDGQFFFDMGRVYNNMSDISLTNMKFDGGAGLRLRTKDYFLLRFQMAYGGEGLKVLLKTSQEF